MFKNTMECHFNSLTVSSVKNMDNHCYLIGISLLIIALLISLFIKVTTVELLVETHNVTFFATPTNHSAVALFA